ncbi:CTLH/CRA C-terminal to lish motif domain-containing protein [Pavlovales sp. CCMP2436]|nr:CTLH/CRA C-terminal to lish motif domain-containing protein [Pavlovales sp. CCMP2436]|mmetsp:Transcript_17756/g.41326  ORF Transcript_17756/g.41326 Transcript_17756/m.41326 type:complete len:274 (+) Transcript_17756:83-904(+)
MNDEGEGEPHVEESPRAVLPAFTLPAWQARLDAVEMDTVLLNRLVLDLLVVNGHKEAAEAFAGEAGLPLDGMEVSALAERTEIRLAVQRGDVQAAVDGVNALDPGVLRENAPLTFRLRNQQLIEIIRTGAVEEALLFAPQLAPAGLENPAFLADLEKTMALLAFEDPAACPVGGLLETAQRLETASELNRAILAARLQQHEAKLPVVLGLLLWSQEVLAERGVSFPRVLPQHLPSGQLSLQTGSPRCFLCDYGFTPIILLAMAIYAKSLSPPL